MNITTNGTPRNITDAYELTESERAEFDYLDWDAIDAGRDSASFVRYRGQLYDLGEFMRTEPGGELEAAGWQGYAADSAFSATVVKYAGEDQVIIGYAYA